VKIYSVSISNHICIITGVKTFMVIYLWDEITIYFNIITVVKMKYVTIMISNMT